MAKESMIKCPICGRSVVREPEKSWQYGIYKVGRYKCEYGHPFNLYESEKRTFTIPKAKVEFELGYLIKKILEKKNFMTSSCSCGGVIFSKIAAMASSIHSCVSSV